MNGPIAVARTSPMQEAIDMLRTSHERMYHQVDRAESVFQLVLRPASPRTYSSGTAPAAASEGELVDLIKLAARVMEGLADRLADLNNRSAL